MNQNMWHQPAARFFWADFPYFDFITIGGSLGQS